jgi:hypothetical protein
MDVILHTMVLVQVHGGIVQPARHRRADPERERVGLATMRSVVVDRDVTDDRPTTSGAGQPRFWLITDAATLRSGCAPSGAKGPRPWLHRSIAMRA